MSRYHTAYLLIEAAGKKRVKNLAAKHGFTEDEIRAMAEFDPSKTDKFLGWIAAQAKAGELSIPTNGLELKTMLEDFDRKGKLTGESDINKWTFTGLKEKLSATESKGEVNRSKVEEGQRVFYEKAPWKVIEITTPEAASKLLRDPYDDERWWCIKDPKFWNDYGCDEGTPAYLVLKDGNEYACMVPHRGELKDTDDEPLKPTEEFIDLLYEQLGWVELTTGDFESFAPYAGGIEEIAKDPDLAYHYALHVIHRPFPAGEPAIARGDPWNAYSYAVEVINAGKGYGERVRWPEGEAAIASDALMAFEYASNIIEGPFPEGEAAIANNPEYAKKYGKLIGDPSWADKYSKATSATQTP